MSSAHGAECISQIGTSPVIFLKFPPTLTYPPLNPISLIMAKWFRFALGGNHQARSDATYCIQIDIFSLRVCLCVLHKRNHSCQSISDYLPFLFSLLKLIAPSSFRLRPKIYRQNQETDMVIPDSKYVFHHDHLDKHTI